MSSNSLKVFQVSTYPLKKVCSEALQGDIILSNISHEHYSKLYTQLTEKNFELYGEASCWTAGSSTTKIQQLNNRPDVGSPTQFFNATFIGVNSCRFKNIRECSTEENNNFGIASVEAEIFNQKMRIIYFKASDLTANGYDVGFQGLIAQINRIQDLPILLMFKGVKHGSQFQQLESLGFTHRLQESTRKDFHSFYRGNLFKNIDIQNIKYSKDTGDTSQRYDECTVELTPLPSKPVPQKGAQTTPNNVTKKSTAKNPLHFLLEHFKAVYFIGMIMAVLIGIITGLIKRKHLQRSLS